MLRLIDSTPIPLGKLFDWAKSNGRFRGMKAHVVYDPDRDLPRILDITDANINDAQIGRQIEIEPGLTYVFDKGYCHYGWWRAIHAAEAFFVTRPKTNMGLTVKAERQYRPSRGDGFIVTGDQKVALWKRRLQVADPLRRIEIVREEDGKTISVITNDRERSAAEIAQAYKFRWQIDIDQAGDSKNLWRGRRRYRRASAADGARAAGWRGSPSAPRPSGIGAHEHAALRSGAGFTA